MIPTKQQLLDRLATPSPRDELTQHEQKIATAVTAEWPKTIELQISLGVLLSPPQRTRLGRRCADKGWTATFSNLSGETVATLR